MTQGTEAAQDEPEIVVNGDRPIAEVAGGGTGPAARFGLAYQRRRRGCRGGPPAGSEHAAQAVGRLPGVAIQRDQGRARYLNLRGAPASWTTVSFDGVTVISPAGRQTLFDTIPAAIAQQVVVRKAVTPDMTGETVAGNIDIITRSGFDFPGFQLTGKLGRRHPEPRPQGRARLPR